MRYLCIILLLASTAISIFFWRAGRQAGSKTTWFSNVAAILRDDRKSRDSEARTEEVDISFINLWLEVLLHKKNLNP